MEKRVKGSGKNRGSKKKNGERVKKIFGKHYTQGIPKEG